MTASTAELFTAQTAEEIEQEALDELAAEDVDEAGIGDRSVARTLVGVEARSEQRLQELRATLARVGFLEGAAETLPDEWIDLAVRARFGITRIPAARAVRLVRVANAATGSPRDEAAGTAVLETAGGIQFENADRLTVAAGATSDVFFRARVAGLGGNLPDGELLTSAGARFLPSMPGLSITADQLVTAGRPKETNAKLIERGVAHLVPDGIASAYVRLVAAAFDAAGQENPVTSVRVDDANPFGPGSVAVYLAEATGAASPATIALVDAYLQARRADAAGPLVVAAAAEAVISVAGVLYASGNPSALADADIALAVYQVEAQGTAIVYVAELYQRLMGIVGVYNWAPQGMADITLSANEVPVFVNDLELAG